MLPDHGACFAAALRTMVKSRLANISTVVANSIHDVIREVVATFFDGNVHE